MFERIVFGIFVAMIALAMDNSALAQNSSQMNNEVMCRTKAKDLAVQMYQSCVTESRNKRIEEIRKEYQAKLANLKNYYDGELKKMGNGNQATAPQGKARNAKRGKAVTGGNAVSIQAPYPEAPVAMPMQQQATQAVEAEATQMEKMSAQSSEVSEPNIDADNLDVINVQER